MEDQIYNLYQPIWGGRFFGLQEVKNSQQVAEDQQNKSCGHSGPSRPIEFCEIFDME